MKFYKSRILPLVLFTLLSISLQQAKGILNTKPVTVYSWWDYIPPGVVKKLEAKGYRMSLIEYRSNEVALSDLISGRSDYDIVIVSNWVLNVLEDSQKIDIQSLRPLLSKRKYLPFTTNISRVCVPYLWSTTTFAADSKEITEGPKSISDLGALKKKGYSIGIVDDPIEFAARIIMDNQGNCKTIHPSKNILNRLTSCSSDELLRTPENLEQSFFRNTLEPMLGPKTAIYGWHGVVGGLISRLPDYEFYVPKGRPVVGLDYVCVLNGAKKPYLADFVERLTNEESTNLNIEKTQYFSPYVRDTGKYSPKVKQLKNELVERLREQEPIILAPPSREAHAKINKWWQKVRYAKKAFQ